MTQSPKSTRTDPSEGLFLQPEWRYRPWGQLHRRPIQAGSGRGQVALIDHPRGVLAERAYRHGGFRRHFLANWFWHSARPSQEFRVHQKVFDNHIPTVEPVGWRETSGWVPGWRRYWYYTVYLPGASPLTEVLKLGVNQRSILAQAAKILHSLYNLGIYHKDLNLHNWLVWMNHLRMIDFDGAKHMEWSPQTYIATCLKRMVRSAVKLGLAGHRMLYLRFCIQLGRQFNLSPRQIANAVPKDAARVSFWRELRWKLSGGHRQ